MDVLQQLQKELGNNVVASKNISAHLTFRTKTFAEFFLEAKSKEDIIKATYLCKQLDIPFLLIGGGSNLAVTKEVISGLVVKNAWQEKTKIDENEDTVMLRVSSGYPMGKLVMETVNAGLEGFEYHLGLPGTIGGGICMNSKWTKPLSYLGDYLVEATLLDKGNIQTVQRDYFNFSYDYSVIQDTGEIILDLVFKLKKNEPALLKKRAQQSLAYRKKTQPFGVATCGCFFQNVNGESAGKMIDMAGLKNTTSGSFTVSDIHANFIVNNGEGNAADLLTLLTIIEDRVYEKFGIQLKKEVIVI